METVIHTILMMLLTMALLGAAISDVQRSRIPNVITLPLAGLGLALHFGLNGWEGLLFSLEGFGVGFGLLVLFYAGGGMGAGDVKLLGAVGAVIGPSDVFVAFLATATLGGLYAISLMILTWGFPNTAERVKTILTTWVLTRSFALTSSPSTTVQPKLRYGLVIGLGTLCTQGWQWMGG